MLSVDAPGEQFPLWTRIKMGDGVYSPVTVIFFFLAIFALDISQGTHISLCLPYDT